MVSWGKQSVGTTGLGAISGLHHQGYGEIGCIYREWGRGLAGVEESREEKRKMYLRWWLVRKYFHCDSIRFQGGNRSIYEYRVRRDGYSARIVIAIR